MTGKEFTGKTVEEALKAAAAELGAPESEIGYEILERGAKGFLGIGGTLARIRAWSKRQERTETAEAPKPREPREARPRGERPQRREPRERRERPAGQERREPRPPRERTRQPRVAQETRPREEPVSEAPARVEEPSPASAAQGHERLMGLLRDTLQAMELEVSAQVRTDTPEELVVDLEGRDVAILIGRGGQTLDALQFLVGIATKHDRVPNQRLILDAEQYRERHAETLRRKALEYARQVKETGEEAVLDPQPARDRRIIHTALANDPGVYTYSEGEGEDRHVVISPRK